MHYADPSTQAAWRTGMKAVAAGNSTPAEIVALMARNEANPTTDLEHFFPRLKRMAIEGYALSDVGMHQHFGYKGDTAIHHFTGCTHPEHQRP